MDLSLFSPVGNISQGAKIIVYGVNNQELLRAIMEQFQIQAIVDEDYQEYESSPTPVYPVTLIKEANYDFVLLLVKDRNDYRKKLYVPQKMNVPLTKIAYLGQESVLRFIRDNRIPNYSLHSGERQTGQTLDAIRFDHVARYALAAEFLKIKCHDGTQYFGLDCFCGVGYGCFLLTQSLKNAVMLGIDASAEAINRADISYGNQRNFFVNKFFPFELPRNCFDFVVSFESIEHVPNGYKLLESLTTSVKTGGYLFFSVPNDNVISLALNPNRFHYRHYKLDELQNFLSGKFKIEEWFGQNVYEMAAGKCVKLLSKEAMIPIPKKEGQNLIFVCKKVC